MPAPEPRDLDLARKQLLEWLSGRLPGASDLRIENLRGPEATGFSSDTLMFDLHYQEDRQEQQRGLVARIKPTFYQVFPEYDLHRQFRVMQTLAPTAVPVPRVFWEEDDESVLGAPFFVMELVKGRVPTDNPPYHLGGWVAEASDQEREALWWDGLRTLAEIHRLDYRELGLDFLQRPGGAATPLETELAYYEKYLEWAARGRAQPTTEAALQWIRANRPVDEPTGIAWGDARIGNMIFEDGRVSAVLDWEMVTLGSPMMDLGWWVFLDRHHSEGLESPRLAGFPSYEASLARYEEWSDVPVKHLEFYQVFAGFRFAVIMIRLAQQQMEYGGLPADTDYETNNIVTRLLARLLELPPPGDPGEGTWQ
jgi:aminoglycoside phosphotransferase (APT) family kinase protein